ncbi:hypothetical protein BVIET440_30430 [Burkholderia vietnamiensis]|nr:hypothetical protein BVI2075_320024 [Burkholderia vietnamiensis]
MVPSGIAGDAAALDGATYFDGAAWNFVRQASLQKKYGFPSYSLRKRDVCLTGIPHTGSWSCAPVPPWSRSPPWRCACASSSCSTACWCPRVPWA